MYKFEQMMGELGIAEEHWPDCERVFDELMGNWKATLRICATQEREINELKEELYEQGVQ